MKSFHSFIIRFYFLILIHLLYGGHSNHSTFTWFSGCAILEGCFQCVVYIIVLNNVLTPENACRMLIAKRHIKIRLYSAIKWKIYNEHVTNIVWYSVTTAFFPCWFLCTFCLFFIARFCYLSIKSPVHQEGCTTPRTPYTVLSIWKMTMIKTRPITIATALAPPNIYNIHKIPALPSHHSPTSLNLYYTLGSLIPGLLLFSKQINK